MVSSTCNGVLMIFNTQCFYTSLTHFFYDSIRSTCTCIRCLHFLKFDHACTLVHHGVPTATFGSFHKAEKLPERHEGENAGKTREGAMNARPFLCMEATITKYVHVHVYRSMFDI